MIHATLQIKTSSHRALRKKTLAQIKDSSGKPILLCSLTPRKKKEANRGELRQQSKFPNTAQQSYAQKRTQPGVKRIKGGGKSWAIHVAPAAAPRKKSAERRTIFFCSAPLQGIIKSLPPFQQKSAIKSRETAALKWKGTTWEMLADATNVAQLSPLPFAALPIESKTKGKRPVSRPFAPFLALRSSKPQSQRRRRLIVSFLKKLASRQSTAGKRLYDPLLANNDALNINSKRLAHPALPFNHSTYEPSLYSNQNLSGDDLFKSLQGNLSPRLRHKSLDLEAKLLGLKLAKACILKGIQSIDVVIQEYTKPTCLLLQGLRMAGVRFNRLRILRAADYNYDVDFVSDRENKQLALARESSCSFFPSLKESNFGKDPHVTLLDPPPFPRPSPTLLPPNWRRVGDGEGWGIGQAGGERRGDNSRPLRWKKGGESRATLVAPGTKSLPTGSGAKGGANAPRFAPLPTGSGAKGGANAPRFAPLPTGSGAKPLPTGSGAKGGANAPRFAPLFFESGFAPLPRGPSFLLRSSNSDYVALPFGQSKAEDVNLPEKNRHNFVSWLFDIRPKHELFQILVKSRLIKKSNRHKFWQVRSSSYKIEKLLYRKNRRGVIKERVYCPLIQKKAVKKWKAFTYYSTAFKAKQQAFVQRTPSYRLRRNTSPFVSQSSSKSCYAPLKAALLFGRVAKSGALAPLAKQKKTLFFSARAAEKKSPFFDFAPLPDPLPFPIPHPSSIRRKKGGGWAGEGWGIGEAGGGSPTSGANSGGTQWATRVAPAFAAEKKRTFFCYAPLLLENGSAPPVTSFLKKEKNVSLVGLSPPVSLVGLSPPVSLPKKSGAKSGANAPRFAKKKGTLFDFAEKKGTFFDFAPLPKKSRAKSGANAPRFAEKKGTLFDFAPLPKKSGGTKQKKALFFSTANAPRFAEKKSSFFDLAPLVELKPLRKNVSQHSQKGAKGGATAPRFTPLPGGSAAKGGAIAPRFTLLPGGSAAKRGAVAGAKTVAQLPSPLVHPSLSRGGVARQGIFATIFDLKRIQKRVAWLRRSLLHTSRKYGKRWGRRSLSFKLQKRRGFQKRRRFHYRFAPIIANVQNTLNNTIITITDRSGNTKVWCSSGSIGLKASRRSTNYAAQSVAEAVAKKCRKLGIKRVEVRVQGVGYGKPSALKGLRIGGLKIKRIVDRTSKPHNGCRAPKKRRV